MEVISNEVKAKVFAMYLGQQIRFDSQVLGEGIVDFKEFPKWFEAFGCEGFKLILRTIDQLTDEEKSKINTIEDVDNNENEDGCLSFGKSWSDCFLFKQRVQKIFINRIISIPPINRHRPTFNTLRRKDFNRIGISN